LFDAVGRSVGWFTGRLEAIPSAMPTSEELPWPEELGPWSVARMVYPQDRERFERLILSAHDVLPQQNALWRQSVELQVLRLLLRGRLRVAQVESFAFLSVGAALPFVLTGTHLGMLVGALLLALGVQLSWLIGPLRTVRDHEGELPPLDSRPHRAALGPAIRPLGHAVFMATLTFAIVGGKTVDSSVAEPGLAANNRVMTANATIRRTPPPTAIRALPPMIVPAMTIAGGVRMRTTKRGVLWTRRSVCRMLASERTRGSTTNTGSDRPNPKSKRPI
jgi:hypothetical protein